MNYGWVCEYLRLVAYALVMIVSVVAIVTKRKLEYMNMTNFIAASGMFFSVFYFLILGLDKDLSRNLVLTPIMMSWAALIFYLFIKSE
jgi:predicted neutral ceramidase superfamily lipid hydrolase